MADTFEESIREARKVSEQTEDDENERLEAGQTCPNCEEFELFEIRHERDSRFDTKPHADAPVSEMVCVHCGIQVGYMSEK